MSGPRKTKSTPALRHVETGRAGEAAVDKWLAQEGWQVLKCNWRIAGGEADRVAVRADGERRGVLVEVKSTRAGRDPVERLSVRQRQRLWTMAEAAQQLLGLERMDVALALVELRADGQRLRWLVLEPF
jgi:Holliday junction resolvase-like predicted endonuclease